MKLFARSASCLLLLALVASCGDAKEEQEQDLCVRDNVVCLNGDVCNPSTGECERPKGLPWSPGEQAFRDASSDWGLDGLAANGQRISVTDVDGDGWADLSVRRAGGGKDDFSSGGERASWLLRNTGEGGFEDVTKASGLVATRSGADANTGRKIDLIIWGDVDNDGDLDAYTAFNKQNAQNEDTAEIMLNEGDGTFVFAAADDPVRNAGAIDSPGGASFVDVDRDGALDLWISQYAAQSPLQDRLLLGDGTGGFTEATADAGLSTEEWTSITTLNQAEGHSLSWGATACDLNGDGTPELMAASYGRAPNHLWLGQRADDGEVSFANESVASAYAFDDRTDWTDNESARCYCQLNPDAPDCDGVPAPELIQCNANTQLRWNHNNDREAFRLGGNSGTTVCADVNNDGWMDLLTTEIVHWDVGSSSDPSELLYNKQDPSVRFERPGNEATGLTREHELTAWNDGDITAAVFDFDNDGRKDVYIGSTDYPGTRGHLWHQKEDGTFERVPLADGIDHTSSHGVGVADYDRDGDLDIVVGHSRFRCGSGDHCYAPEEGHARLFENTIGQANNWLQVELEGADGTNRKAIGARVTVQTDAGTQVSEVGGGHGHYGVQHELARHFGLGAAEQATVTVRWPDENLSEETFDLEAGQRYIWKQGEEPVVAPQ
ncbi:CRTAC1 family protein [Persicimonas caeni]|uniref:CRTAC1 family protein n=1 Tax=Persicimonas caeni TaxID=2292766 RepID=A0A4Y6PUC6_PERCE|nr:CRTAC1 family protein [Persicimonas caeni]QDG51908.1 CRTAC1 family protein [Persicimonas caeni]QED33129.1 CRTAC1 family protein [Persicimonas caeni]